MGQERCVDGVNNQIIHSYNLIATDTSAVSAPTAFPIGVTSGTIDLLKAKYSGIGSETKAVYLGFLFTGKPAGSAVVFLTGAVDGGPEEPLCSLVLTIGSVVETGDYRWADTIVPTNYHLGAGGVKVEDSGNSHPCKVGLDAIGYRYIRKYVITLTTTTELRTYVRIF